MTLKDIDIIIPCGDSAEELKVTINSLISQKKFINNIFVIISGKNKKSLKHKIEKDLSYEKNFFRLKIFEDPTKKTTPGSARNYGINKAFNTSSTFIGFIDSSMSVKPNWLSSFFEKKNISNLRIGSTQYLPKPNKKIQLISALLTYGTRYSANTVPGTIIKKIICKQFAISIRWGEDLVWMENYKNYYNSKPQYECSYSFFKNSISETYKKYIKQIQDALKNKSTYRKNLYMQSLFTVGLYSFLIIFGLTKGFEFSLIILIAYQIFKFVKKNKLIYLFKIEGTISIALNISLDLIKIFIITRSII